MNYNELHLFIKNQRKAKGLSQSAMAEKLHIVLKTYQNIENGITRIDIERLMQIAHLIDLDLHAFFEISKKDNEEKTLYKKLLTEKELYINKLENDIKFYQELIRKKEPFL